jgi:hypothetical protein
MVTTADAPERWQPGCWRPRPLEVLPASFWLVVGDLSSKCYVIDIALVLQVAFGRAAPPPGGDPARREGGRVRCASPHWRTDLKQLYAAALT